MTFDEFQFASPWWLLGLVVVPLLGWMIGGRTAAPAIRFSSLEGARPVGRPARGGRGGFRQIGWLLSLALFFVALARPRLGNTQDITESSGVDIVLALDVSSSMLAEDFTIGDSRANRLDAVKDVTRRFIDGRPNDRIGIVAFAGLPYLVSPLTLDHGWLEKNLDRLRIGLVQDGTAIAAAIGSAANRLKQRESKSKILILLTDGDETVQSTLTPATAAEAAKTLNIKIYTIAAGTRGTAPYPVGRDLFGNVQYRNMPVSVNEESLKQIAEIGGGKFFRATDSESLNQIFSNIDQLEKTEVKLKRSIQWRDIFAWIVAAGALLGALQAIHSLTLGRTLP
jgi:Ca-activated chloride channel family protein